MTGTDGLNFEKSDVIFYADPDMFDRILYKFPDHPQIISTYHFHTNFRYDMKLNKNEALLDALGEFKDEIVSHAEILGNRAVTSVEYFVNTSSVVPMNRQTDVGWHSERKATSGLALITSSALPTLLLARAKPHEEFKPSVYLHAVEEYQDAYTIYDQNLVNSGVNEGEFEIYNHEPGEVFEIDSRIHRPDNNLTSKILPRVFLAAEVTYKRDHITFLD